MKDAPGYNSMRMGGRAPLQGKLRDKEVYLPPCSALRSASVHLAWGEVRLAQFCEEQAP